MTLSLLVEPVSQLPAVNRQEMIERKDSRMNRSKNSLLTENGVAQKAKNWVTRYKLVLPVAIIGLMLTLTVSAQKDATTRLTRMGHQLQRFAPPLSWSVLNGECD
jgi:hypothetical protein